MELSEKLSKGLSHIYCTSSAMNLYGNAVMMPIETLCIGIEKSADARLLLTGVKFITTPVVSFFRDRIEDYLGFTKNSLKSKIGWIDTIYWLGVAGLEIGGNYLIYNKAFNADNGWRSVVPAVTAYALTANGKFLGKVLDTFKDGFNISPCVASAFPDSMPVEEKRKVVNRGCAAAYASIASFYLYAHSPEISSLISNIFNH